MLTNILISFKSFKKNFKIKTKQNKKKRRINVKIPFKLNEPLTIHG